MVVDQINHQMSQELVQIKVVEFQQIIALSQSLM